MRIAVLEGGPNRHGSSSFLAEQFIRGAKGGCSAPSMTKHSRYSREVYELGCSL